MTLKRIGSTNRNPLIIGRIYSIKKGRNIYLWMNILGMSLSVYLALYVKNLLLAGIYPLAILLLWLYAVRLKKSCLTGNLLVSLFCAFVAGIVWFAERNAYFNAGEWARGEISWIFSAYLLFAAISTLYREIIKDIEDQDGDRIINARTFPIQFGTRAARFLAILTALSLLFLLIYWSLYLLINGKLIDLIYTFAGIILPLLYSLIKLSRASEKKDFSHLSQLAKYIMLSGIVYLVVYGITN